MYMNIYMTPSYLPNVYAIPNTYRQQFCACLFCINNIKCTKIILTHTFVIMLSDEFFVGLLMSQHVILDMCVVCVRGQPARSSNKQNNTSNICVAFVFQFVQCFLLFICYHFDFFRIYSSRSVVFVSICCEISSKVSRVSATLGMT